MKSLLLNKVLTKRHEESYMKWSKFSFKSKLLIMNFLSLGVFAIGVGYSFFSLVNYLQSEKYNELKTQRVYTSSQTAAIYFERYGDVQAFANNPVVQDRDFKRMVSVFDKYAEIYGIYDHIMFLDKDGKWVAGSQNDINGKPVNLDLIRNINFSQEGWFKRVLAKDWTTSPSNMTGTVVSKFEYHSNMDKVFSEKLPHQFFATPVYNSEGLIDGLVVTIANPKWITNGIAEILDKKIKKGDKEFVGWIVQDEVMVLRAQINAELKPTFEYPFEKVNSYFGKTQAELYYNGTSPLVLNTKGNNYVLNGDAINDNYWSSELNWGVMIADKKENFFRETTKQSLLSALVVALCVIASALMVHFFAVGSSKKLDLVVKELDVFANELTQTSEHLLKGSQDLASASTQQAAGVQETMAAIEEISAMVSRNAESAEKSQTQSVEAESAANRGQETVNKMLESMQQIKESNEHYSQQLGEANDKLSQITKVINEIAGKTKVINEIVFQTKLLSFNASVEAARAGEYGKGFAVVAEEVGNLAAMSGQAALEISKLLEQSTTQVSQVVDESKNLSANMVGDIQERVELAEQVASEVAESLGEILQNSQIVAGMTAEIANASREQSTGVAEISKAIGEIEVGVQKVNQNANQSAGDSASLSDKIKGLNLAISEIRSFTQGHGVTNPVLSKNENGITHIHSNKNDGLNKNAA